MSNFTVKTDNSNHQYFAMTPHIIYEIGLKANEIAVYGAIKRCSGEDGICIKSKGNLAKSAGVCPKTIFTIIQKLSQINPVLGKPLIKCSQRYTEDGNQSTNQIEITDIWPENMQHFKINIGEVKFTPPHVNVTRGGRQELPGGEVRVTYKEEPFKKNPIKKNTTTPTSSLFVDKVGVVVVSENKNKEAEQAAAKSLHEWMGKEAYKDRRRKMGKYHDNVQWGDLWIIPIMIYEKLIERHGIKYFQSQLEYMHKEQMDFDKGIKKKGVDNPEAYLKRACKENWADSQDNKKERK